MPWSAKVQEVEDALFRVLKSLEDRGTVARAHRGLATGEAYPRLTLAFDSSEHEPRTLAGDWRAVLTFAVGVETASSSLEEAYSQARELCGAVMDAVLADPTLGGACESATVRRVERFLSETERTRTVEAWTVLIDCVVVV